MKPENLEECDLPVEGEQLGEALTKESDIKKYVDLIRPEVLAEKSAHSNGDTDLG